MMFYVYEVLIQNIKNLIEQNNVTIYHTLRDGNQYGLIAKLRTSSDIDLLFHDCPP